MALNIQSLNQKYNYLLSLVNSITSGLIPIPTTANLDQVLTNGNNAGANDIDLNNNDILQVNNIDLVTINGSAYPPSSSATSIDVTADDTNATYYLTFVDGAGASKTLYADTSTTALSINPNTNVFRFGDTMKIDGIGGGGRVALGSSAGVTSQNNSAVAVGNNAGGSNQGVASVAIGNNTGYSSQNSYGIAIGANAGYSTQGSSATAIGRDAGYSSQSTNAVAIGRSTGRNLQGQNAVAVGSFAGNSNASQNSVLLGGYAGQNNAGLNAICVGYNAGGSFNVPANNIIIDAKSGANITASGGTDRLFIDPIRNATQTTALGYDTTTKEITYYTPASSSAIPPYTDDTARDTAIPSPAVADFCYLTSTGEFQVYNFGMWLTLSQVVPLSLTITGFTLGVDYSVTYLDAGGSVIGSPVSTGSTLYQFNPTTTTNGTITSSFTTTNVYYLLVAGGGGGAGSVIGSSDGGGGGAGGLLSNYPSGATLTLVGSTSYNISVGQGGAGGVAGSSVGNTGINSVLNHSGGTITTFGGGRGGSGAGGSGGGGFSASGTAGAGGAGVSGQGNNGGAGGVGTFIAGGGGGAGAVGGTGAGGNGLSNSITGTAITYAGGGGGGTNGGTIQPGGTGGGGNGGYASLQTGQPGTNGLGGGGGGGGFPTISPGFPGGDGGSGFLAIRFPSFVKV